MVAGLIHADPLGLLVAFGGGMLSFLSPCVLPLVPGYLSMVSGLSATELGALGPPKDVVMSGGVVATDGVATDGASGSPLVVAGVADLRGVRARLLRAILLFIAGFTVVFTILGASASAVGHLFHTHLPELRTFSGVLIVIFGIVLVAMASGVRLPTAMFREHRFVIRPSALGAWAPPLMGIAFAFAWTPCIGPILASVLALAAGTGGTTTGGIALLLAYSMGLGVPFLLFGLAFARMTDLVARVRSRLAWVDLVGGVILVIFGLLLMTGNVDVIAIHISNWLRDLHLGRLATS